MISDSNSRSFPEEISAFNLGSETLGVPHRLGGLLIEIGEVADLVGHLPPHRRRGRPPPGVVQTRHQAVERLLLTG